ncbi:MAG TPA: hypothetical protein VFV91_14505 [Gaiellaceae bacterium]|nr:hypothetical protein [Gaiellaceae bacterium]
MPQVLTTSAQIMCGHGGQAQLSSSSKLKVNGTPVLLQAGVGPTINGCTVQTTNSTAPDLVATVSGGLATKLASGGAPVLLSTFTGTGSGLPQPSPLTATESQTKVLAT